MKTVKIKVQAFDFDNTGTTTKVTIDPVLMERSRGAIKFCFPDKYSDIIEGLSCEEVYQASLLNDPDLLVVLSYLYNTSK